MFHKKALNRTINVCLVKIVSQKNQIKTATFSTVKSINKINAIGFVFEQIIFTKNASKSKKTTHLFVSGLLFYY